MDLSAGAPVSLFRTSFYLYRVSPASKEGRVFYLYNDYYLIIRMFEEKIAVTLKINNLGS